MPDLTIVTTAQQVTDDALLALQQGHNVIIRAHAGAGKTGGRSSGTVRMAAALARTGLRVALLVAQNDQVAETLARLTATWGDLTTTYVPPSQMPAEVGQWMAAAQPRNLAVARASTPARRIFQAGRGLFVMTTAKFTFLAPPGAGRTPQSITVVEPFDVVIVDEAWMAPASLWLHLDCLARLVALIGDPGQIMPWLEDSPFYVGMAGSPVEPLPDLVRRERAGNVRVFELPVTRRNPSHTTDITGHLPAYAASPTRPMHDAAEVPITLGALPVGRGGTDAALRRMVARGVALQRLPAGVAPQDDTLVADACAAAVGRLLSLGAELGHPNGVRPLGVDDVAVLVAHHDQKAAVQRALATAGRIGTRTPRVATFNTIQGATVAIAVVWHPLSGRTDVSDFHADAGRLTVGLTRHTHGCLIISRDGVGDRLSNAPVCSDLEGDARDARFAGLMAHAHIWQRLA
jgi:hypothetical protein